MMKLLISAIGIAALVAIVSAAPDIRRYMRISSM
jgi:hypothetical protein